MIKIWNKIKRIRRTFLKKYTTTGDENLVIEGADIEKTEVFGGVNLFDFTKTSRIKTEIIKNDEKNYTLSTIVAHYNNSTVTESAFTSGGKITVDLSELSPEGDPLYDNPVLVVNIIADRYGAYYFAYKEFKVVITIGGITKTLMWLIFDGNVSINGEGLDFTILAGGRVINKGVLPIGESGGISNKFLIKMIGIKTGDDFIVGWIAPTGFNLKFAMNYSQNEYLDKNNDAMYYGIIY